MRRLLFITMLLGVSILSNIQKINAQPISLEIMCGNNYGEFTMVMNKKFSGSSKFGFFHLDIIEFDYINNINHDLMLQNLLYYEPFKNFRLTGGAFYGGKPGFKATLGLQYNLHTKNLFVLIAPRINIEDNPTYDIFSLLKAEIPINDNLNIFSSIQSLNLLNKDGNIKCGQDLRLGVDIKGYKFGLAAGFEQSGPHFAKSNNFGVFVQKEIF